MFPCCVSFCLFVSDPHSPFVFFSVLSVSLAILLPRRNTAAIGFLSLHIVLLLRRVSPFLMSSATVALSLRLSTNDLLAFSFLYLLLSLSSAAAIFISHPLKLLCLLDQKLNDRGDALPFSPAQYLLSDALTERYYLPTVLGRIVLQTAPSYSDASTYFSSAELTVVKTASVFHIMLRFLYLTK